MARRRRALGRPKYWPGIPWLRGSAKPRKKRRASGVASRAKNAPKHCKVSLGSCMRGGGGRAKAGKCMKAYWSCINGG